MSKLIAKITCKNNNLKESAEESESAKNNSTEGSFDSPEFKKPVSDAEAEGYLKKLAKLKGEKK